VVVLDLGLPDMDGTAVIASLRTWTQVPVIVLSARDGQRDKVAALDVGADDYVSKPFGIEELLARLRAATRRAAPRDNEPVVAAGDLVIDLAAARVRRKGADVRLTPTEWHLLEVLVRRRGTLVARGDLLREVWGPAYESQTNYLRVYLAQLRRKLEDNPSSPRHLITEAGLGYRFET
jgi:two-component system KDP operon response regulator KdpE